MTTNQEAYAKAANLHAKYRSFVQPEGVCDGFTSWWLRARLQGKDFWQEKYFQQSIDPSPGSNNNNALKDEAVDPKSAKTEDAITNKNLQKARVLQGFIFGTTTDRAYITNGTRVDKQSKLDKPVGKFINSENSKSISDFSSKDDNAKTLLESFLNVYLNQYVAKYSVSTINHKGEAGAHALGLDCQQDGVVRYFDPNIGEFQFSDILILSDWWTECYKNRKKTVGAFGIMTDFFKADYYKAIKK